MRMGYCSCPVNSARGAEKKKKTTKVGEIITIQTYTKSQTKKISGQYSINTKRQ